MPSSSANLPRAIIVDDSSTMRSLLREILTAEGVEVIEQLSSGGTLLPEVARLSPDIVCLDYNLPGINGIELLKSIASAHPQVAVLIITGDSDPGLQSLAAESGASGFIHKPFSQNQVGKEIRQIIQAERILKAEKRSLKLNTDVEVPELKVMPTAVVADDSKAIRALLMTILTNNGIKVTGEAANGIQAVELVENLKPNVACLDIDMPSMNGMDALTEIRNKSPQTKVMMISGSGTRELVTQALMLGASGFIVKPFDPEKIRQTIDKVLGKPVSS